MLVGDPLTFATDKVVEEVEVWGVRWSELLSPRQVHALLAPLLRPLLLSLILMDILMYDLPYEQGWKTGRFLVPFRPGAIFSVASYPCPGLSP